MNEADDSVGQQRDHGLTDEQVRRAEAHRGFVRQMHNELNATYGRGGGAVLMALIVLVVVAVVTGWWTQIALWVLGLTAVLMVLFGIRKWIYRRREQMRRQVEQYCETNGVSVQTLLEYYDAEQMYPFFATIFEQAPAGLPDDGQTGSDKTAGRRQQ